MCSEMGKTGRHHEIFYARTISAAEVLKQLSLSLVGANIGFVSNLYIYRCRCAYKQSIEPTSGPVTTKTT